MSIRKVLKVHMDARKKFAPGKDPAGRAGYIRNVRNMRRQGAPFGSGESGVIGPYSPRAKTGDTRPGRFNRA